MVPWLPKTTTKKAKTLPGVNPMKKVQVYFLWNCRVRMWSPTWKKQWTQQNAIVSTSWRLVTELVKTFSGFKLVWTKQGSDLWSILVVSLLNWPWEMKEKCSLGRLRSTLPNTPYSRVQSAIDTWQTSAGSWVSYTVFCSLVELKSRSTSTCHSCTLNGVNIW